MNSIGFRVSPKVVTFAIYDTEEEKIVNIEQLKVPSSLKLPEKLKFIRFSVLDIMREFNVEVAGIRETESSAPTNATRLQLEAVIQEAFASSDLTRYRIGQIASISKWLGFPRQDFNKYRSNELDYEAIEQWSSLNAEEREAVFVAIGATK